MPIHASNDQLVREIERLKTEITRLNGDKVRLATGYGNLVADHKTEINRLQGLVNSNVDQYARNNEDLTRENDRLTSENDRLRKLVESQCIHNGHDVETIFYVGNPDPVSLTCRTCGRTWGVTAHD